MCPAVTTASNSVCDSVTNIGTHFPKIGIKILRNKSGRWRQNFVNLLVVSPYSIKKLEKLQKEPKSILMVIFQQYDPLKR